MIKPLVIAAVMTAFAGASFAQAASSGMSSDKPMAGSSGSMGTKHHAKKMHHKSKASSSSMGAASAGMK